MRNKPICRTKKNGEKCWQLNGKLHRKNGPAIIGEKGDNYWLLYGDLHRIDGPAIEWRNGDKDWYLKGKKYTEEEFLKLTHKK